MYFCIQCTFVYNVLLYTTSYHTSTSGIRKNIALLRPISNEAEGRVGYGMRRAIFPHFHERACDNLFIFKQTWRVT